MELAVLQVLELCIQAKEKGHDCFFEYLPHVNGIQVRIYKNGWEKEKASEKWLDVNLLATTEYETKYTLSTTIDKVIEALKNLIKEEVND